jgi:hypothetical protein
LVLTLINSVLLGQSQFNSLINQGMNQAYNLDLASAEKTFNKVISQKPNSPLGYYHLSRIYFWKFLGSKGQNEFQIFIKYADKAQQKIELELGKNPKDYRTMYVGGKLALYRAMAQSTNNSSVDAFWSSKKAVGYFEDVLELNKKYYDAYLGLGLFDYAMSFVPDFLKWAVNLTGLTSDKERGLRYIKTAYLKGTEDKTEATFHLSKIYSDYVADYDSSVILIKKLMTKYPQNILFNYQYAVTLIKNRQLDQADEVLNSVIKSKNKNLPQTTALAFYRKGQINFLKNRFRNTIKYYSQYLEKTNELDFKGIAALNIALSYKFLGDAVNYKKYLQLAQNGDTDIFDDSYANEKSEEYLEDGISQTELKLVRMKNNLDAGRDKIVFDSLKMVIDKFEHSQDLAVGYAYFGEASLNLRKYPEAEYAANQILTLKLDSEKWTIPIAYFIKAKIKFIKGDKSKAKEFLEQANENDIHEFKDNIQAQIERLHRQLKKK